MRALALLAVTACGAAAAAPPDRLTVSPVAGPASPLGILDGGTADPSSEPRPVAMAVSAAARKSYEEALREEDAATGDAGARDAGVRLTDDELATPMRKATFLGRCNTPDSMKVTIRVAVRSGAARGVTVRTSPPDPAIASCIDDAVRALHWPSSAAIETFTVNY